MTTHTCTSTDSVISIHLKVLQYRSTAQPNKGTNVANLMTHQIAFLFTTVKFIQYSLIASFIRFTKDWVVNCVCLVFRTQLILWFTAHLQVFGAPYWFLYKCLLM